MREKSISLLWEKEYMNTVIRVKSHSASKEKTSSGGKKVGEKVGSKYNGASIQGTWKRGESRPEAGVLVLITW